jgi:hypothetical protein
MKIVTEKMHYVQEQIKIVMAFQIILTVMILINLFILGFPSRALLPVVLVLGNVMLMARTVLVHVKPYVRRLVLVNVIMLIL